MNLFRSSSIMRWRLFGLAAALLLFLPAAGGVVRAGVSYDVTVGLDLSDDSRLFLNLTNNQYAPPEREATAIVRRCRHPEDDYPVVLFLSHASGVPAGRVLDLRLQGLSWADVMFRLHIGPRVLFASLDHDPGPPYGKAWGHYKSHKKGRRIALKDADIVGLTKLQITARHYGMNPHAVLSERGKGVSFERYAATKKRGGKGGNAKAKPAKQSKQGPGKNKKR